MFKFLLIVCLLVPIAAQAQAPEEKGPLTVTTPLTDGLDKIFKTLSDQVKEVEQLSNSLKSTASSSRQDTQTQIDNAARTLSGLVDKLADSADLATQLTALRNAATLHRKRVEEMAKDALSEGDRTALMKIWDKAIADADKTQTKLNNMRERVTNSLKTLRMRQAAVSEFLLAGQFQAALKSLNMWVSDLDATISSLRATLEANKPSA